MVNFLKCMLLRLKYWSYLQKWGKYLSTFVHKEVIHVGKTFGDVLGNNIVAVLAIVLP